ncbi:MAG TPA: GntR family transcriptional regulator [Pyrinomonadaceae bacterium]|nr:GntR family transcriptional regulator [Pyrinomonadaceae bacterium]
MSEKLDIKIGDRTANGPVYAQVREQIETRIKDKQLAAGTALPAPALLAQQLSIDKGEIQRAYFELERAGLVKKKTGRDFLGKEKTTYLVS